MDISEDEEDKQVDYANSTCHIEYQSNVVEILFSRAKLIMIVL